MNIHVPPDWSKRYLQVDIGKYTTSFYLWCNFFNSTACLLFSYVGLNFVTLSFGVNWIFLFDCRSVVLLFTTQPQKVTWTLHVSYSITRRTSTEKLRCEISSTQKFIGRTCSLNEFIPRWKQDENQELISWSMQLPYWAYVTAFLQTDLFLVYLFFSKIKAVPLHWRSDVN